MHPIDIEISKKIGQEQKFIKMDIISHTKWHIAFLSFLSTSIGCYFLFCLITHVKVSVSFTIIISLHFILIGVISFLSIYLDQKVKNRYYAYFILAEIFVNLIFLIIAIYVLVPSQEFKNSLIDNVKAFRSTLGNPELDQIQLSLTCCGVTSAEEFHKKTKEEEDEYLSSLVYKVNQLDENSSTTDTTGDTNQSDNNENEKPSNEDNHKLYHLPLTCCEEVNKYTKCSLELAHKVGCWSAYKDKLNQFKIRSFILIIIVIIIQVLFIVAYSYKIKKSESSE